MRYAMPNPELINGNYYLRLHVPKDVAEKARGTTVAIPVGDAIKYQKVGSVVKVSLLTKVAAEAKHRFTKALAAVEAHWESLRSGPVKLTHKQCVGLERVARSGSQEDALRAGMQAQTLYLDRIVAWCAASEGCKVEDRRRFAIDLSKHMLAEPTFWLEDATP